MVTTDNLGEFVEYYDDGGRYGFLLEINLFGPAKKTKGAKEKDEDEEPSVGVGIIRPFTGKEREVKIALEQIWPVDPAYKKKVREQEEALKKELLAKLPPLMALFG